MSQSQKTREKLVEAGKKVIYEKGFHCARVSDITEKAGLAHGTFYLYFESKEKFLLSLLETVKEELLSLMENGISLIREGNSEQGKVLLFLRTFDLMIKERELAKILFFEAICTSAEFQKFYKESKEIFLRKTQESLELLGLSKSEIKAHILLGTARHFIEMLILSNKEVSSKWIEVLKEVGVFS